MSFLTQRLFGISRRNFGICICVESAISDLDQTVVKVTVSEILMQQNMAMHAADPMGLALGPASCMNHQFILASQTYCGDPQLPECRPLTQTENILNSQGDHQK